jgi:hypothetical protein
VRYLPLCVVSERHRASMYDFQQIPYDLHENDFASWTWTDQPAQRTRDAALSEPIGLGPRLKLGAFRQPVRQLAARLPQVAPHLHAIKERLERGWAAAPAESTRDERYRADARMRAQEFTGYKHAEACQRCDVAAICDGFYADYTAFFGDGDARPIVAGKRVDDPQHFTQLQRKRMHPLDREWVSLSNVR